jgi:hypothetical protein
MPDYADPADPVTDWLDGLQKPVHGPPAKVIVTDAVHAELLIAEI